VSQSGNDSQAKALMWFEGPSLLVVADFLKFFNLCFIGSVHFDGHLTNKPLASILFASAGFGSSCSADAYQQIKKNMKKIFITIHKPPMSIRFAPIMHVLAVTVEPFKFSSR
jgi:hypothetical protein